MTLLTWPGPVASDSVLVTFKQPIARTDPLRSGTYAKTLQFTLSTTAHDPPARHPPRRARGGDSRPRVRRHASAGAIEALHFYFQDPATGDNAVTVLAGETVTFSYPAGASSHNVVFVGAQPSSCAPAIPESASPPGWTATCRFNTPGTYEFVCGLHGQMTGAVVVTGATPTATATTRRRRRRPRRPPRLHPPRRPSRRRPAPRPRPPPRSRRPPRATRRRPRRIPSASTTAPAAPAATALKVAAAQKGQTVKGSLTVARPNSRLKVEILRGKTRLASSTKTVKQGKVTFALKVKGSKKAKLTVRITVTPPTGAPFTASRRVTLKP